MGIFIIAPVRNIVCQLFQRYLKRKNRLDPPTFDPQFLNSYIFTHLFNTFNFSFRMGSAYLPLNQYDKDNRL